MSRVILHSDANSFYASVECLYRPEIRSYPVSVCGDPEARHGIVLTSNRLAKQQGVKTGMAIWQAKQVCPRLIVVPPDYELYVHFSKMMRQIYESYSDRVESFGLDEAWIDLSNPGVSLSDGERMANLIRQRVCDELGITVSVGVSNNKVFAKLGSDLRKPNAVTVIPSQGFEQMIWGLPASDLLYVGPKTTRKLSDIGVRTIGDLAKAPASVLQSLLGKNGLMLKSYAMGLDVSPVMPVTVEAAIKSIGNSTTTPHDIETFDDARCVYFLLAESVGARLREHGFRSKCVSISVRTTALVTYSSQTMLSVPTNITGEIAATAYELFQQRYLRLLPFRSVGISCGSLVTDTTPIQLDMLGVQERREKAEQFDAAVDSVRRRYGNRVVQRGIVMTDHAFASMDPKKENTIHPIPFYAG